MADARIDVEIGSDGAQRGAQVIQNAVAGIKANFVALSVAAVAVEQTLVKIWASAKIGAQFEETMGRLNRQMGAFGSTSQQIVGDLQRVSNATLSIGSAATMSSRALAIGLSPDQIIIFTKAAMLLKDVMQTDLPTAFNEVVTASTGARSTVLANIGIFIDLDQEVKKFAVSAGRSAESITKQERAMISAKAIAAQYQRASAELTDGIVSDASKLEAVEAKWADYAMKIAVAAKVGTIAVLDFANSILEHGEATRRAIDAMTGGLTAWKNTEMFGPPKPYGADTKIKAPAIPEASSIRRDRIQSAADIQTMILRGEEDRMQAYLKAEATMLDVDLQMQKQTAVEVVEMKAQLAMRGLTEHLKTLEEQRIADRTSFDAQKKIIGDSIQENIALDKDFQTKVTANTEAIYDAKHAIEIQKRQDAKDTDVVTFESFKTTGDEMVRQFRENYDVMQDVRKKNLDDIEAYYQGEVEMGISRYASDAEMAAKERVLLRDQMAFKLNLTREEVNNMIFIRNAGDIEGARGIAGRNRPAGMSDTMVDAITESGAGKDIRLAERANNDFFAGWARGLQDYTTRTGTAFNMANDMARRTAQGMEQGFQRFFFDAMTGKFESFKDVLKGVLDFAAQMLSQLAAQMVTVGILKPGLAAIGGMFSSSAGASVSAADMSGKNFPGFTAGGTSAKSMAVSMPVTIINQVEGAKVETKQSTGAGGMPQLEVMITSLVNKAVGQGRMDKAMQSRYRLTPGEK